MMKIAIVSLFSKKKKISMNVLEVGLDMIAYHLYIYLGQCLLLKQLWTTDCSCCGAAGKELLRYPIV